MKKSCIPTIQLPKLPKLKFPTYKSGGAKKRTIIPAELHKGKLYGYHIDFPEKQRRNILLNLLKSDTASYSQLIKRLNIIGIYNKYNHPETEKKIRKDIAFLQKYMSKVRSISPKPKSIRRSIRKRRVSLRRRSLIPLVTPKMKVSIKKLMTLSIPKSKRPMQRSMASSMERLIRRSKLSLRRSPTRRRRSIKRRSTTRRSIKRRSTKRRSIKRRSIKRRSTTRRSTKRRSTKRRSTKRRSTKRRSTTR
mgnify:CR=1 FL=1|jgi:hypothetical protein